MTFKATYHHSLPGITLALIVCAPNIGFSKYNDDVKFSISKKIETAALDGNIKSLHSFAEQYILNKIPSNIQSISEWINTNSDIKSSLLICELIRAFGEDEIISFAAKAKNKPFLAWLLTHPEVLSDYLGGGLVKGKYGARSLTVWQEIWETDKDSRSGLFAKLAAATALGHAQEVRALFNNTPINSLNRYFFYKKSYLDNKLFPQFEKLNVWELRLIMSAPYLDSDLEWCQNRALKPDVKWRSADKIGNACWIVPYRSKNYKGASVQGPHFYDDKFVTLPVIVEYGGVCGAISKMGAAFCLAHGLPALTMGQPGHCAFMWKTAPGNWKIGNDIYGWTQSTSSTAPDALPWGYHGTNLLLLENMHTNNALISQQISWLGSVIEKTDKSRAQKIFGLSEKINPLNYETWQRHINLLSTLKNKNEFDDNNEWMIFTKKMIKSLSSYPYSISELLSMYENKLITKKTSDENRIMWDGKIIREISENNSIQTYGLQSIIDSRFYSELSHFCSPYEISQNNSFSSSTKIKNNWLKINSNKRKLICNYLQCMIDALKNNPIGIKNACSFYDVLIQSDSELTKSAVSFYKSFLKSTENDPDKSASIEILRALIRIYGTNDLRTEFEETSLTCLELIIKKENIKHKQELKNTISAYRNWGEISAKYKQRIELFLTTQKLR